MQRLRIVTYNIAHGRGLQPIQGLTTRRKIRSNLLRIAKLLNELKPDVVALQEIDEDSSWAGSFDQGFRMPPSGSTTDARDFSG
jgi:endonuclease/exonuclease/phosphatase family metal-dependent hydrolase